MASYGSLTRWSQVTSKTDRRAQLDAANAALRSKWERLADPDGVLPPDELAAAVGRLKSAHFRRMSLASAESRRGRRKTTR
ncbi:hypothetical protein O7627_24195 [Solwaraspora sp. WMMD1047]|uniref:hypothetical protein n=1 Tax=Solwaraspora sp. WMMD1047 TaxID=3016102 RepID=UPI0024170FDE|nr:hypothetical protein [Solwaraspora sp. WMMD1047]MDG4832384.1 hypothetical protein [Solwaraspora sp. WMMD1047]